MQQQQITMRIRMIQRIQLQLSSPQPLKKQPIDKPPFANIFTVQYDMYGGGGLRPPANYHSGGGVACSAGRFVFRGSVLIIVIP